MCLIYKSLLIINSGQGGEDSTLKRGFPLTSALSYRRSGSKGGVGGSFKLTCSSPLDIYEF